MLAVRGPGERNAVLPRFAFGLRCLAATAALPPAGIGATIAVQAITSRDYSDCVAMVLGIGGLYHQHSVACRRRVNSGTYKLVLKSAVNKCARTATIDNVTPATGLP